MAGERPVEHGSIAVDKVASIERKLSTKAICIFSWCSMIIDSPHITTFSISEGLSDRKGTKDVCDTNNGRFEHAFTTFGI